MVRIIPLLDLHEALRESEPEYDLVAMGVQRNDGWTLGSATCRQSVDRMVEVIHGGQLDPGLDCGPLQDWHDAWRNEGF